MKMKNTKGFTLIELLAVIVILAIIALIATPIIVGVINDAKKNSATDSAYGVVDAAKLAYTASLMDETSTFSLGSSYSVTSLTVSGTKPTAGTYSVGANGTITITGVKFGNYTCSGTDNKVSCS